jgi:hypothetical protein
VLDPDVTRLPRTRRHEREHSAEKTVSAAAVVRIAMACEATDNDLIELLRCWRLATEPDLVPAPPLPQTPKNCGTSTEPASPARR